MPTCTVRCRPRRHRAASLLTWLALLPLPAFAQSPGAEGLADLRAQIDELRSEYEARIAELEERLAELETQAASPAAAPAPAPTPAASAQSNTYFNPAISVIGNFLAVGGSNNVDPLPVSDLREVEIGFQGVVDPYARADVFVAAGEEGMNVEEGYVTFTALPAQLLAKVGRIRAQFGKTNPLHLHVLPWADEPLPIVNLLGGEEGWRGDGVSVGRLIPLGNTFSELTVQAFRGEAEGLFEASSRSDLAYNAHYRLFRDLTDATNLEVGASWARGPNDASPDSWTTLTGLDATWRWKPLRTATYRGLEIRGELMRSERDQPDGDARSLGWFLSADARLARRWWVGGRVESSERAADDSLRDRGAAVTLTFDPSEFLSLRGEYRHRRYAEQVDADELLLQLQFILGAHGAHPF